LGQMHERLSEITDTLKLELNPELIEIDPSLVVPGDEIYEVQAMDVYKEYSALIQNMLNTYGLQNDGEIFSNHFKSFKRRLFERNDNSTTIKKASAFYRIAYSDKTHLSFPWFIADILMINQQLYSDKDLDKKSFSPYCLENKLSKEINDLITFTKYENGFASFVKNLNDAYSNKKSNTEVCLATARMCQTCEGLDKLLFFVRCWSDKHRLDRILPKVLDALVILFVTGHLTGESCIDLDALEDGSIDLDDLEGGVGRIFLKFLQYISTQEFSSSELHLCPVTKRKLSQEDCLMLYYEAIQTLYPIAFNRFYRCLPGGIYESDRSFEDEIFTIDLPMEVEEIWEEL
uniref:RNA-directed RNA polymerase n=1 Tax=Panagrolaimus sp. PS1159 TaxID=55785 RepID=A0AC35FCA3_9BILA